MVFNFYLHKARVMALCLLVTAGFIRAETTDPLLKTGDQRLQNARSAQTQVDSVYEKTQDIIKEYEARLESVESLEVYNRLLAKQLASQTEEITTLEQSIADAAVIERRITPLLQRMINSLEEFINLDMPFLIEERNERVEKLCAMLTRSDVSTAEKTRRVFEAFEIENDFGRSIEAYTTQVTVDGKSFDADVLRVGRISLMFTLIGQNTTGYWNLKENQWKIENGSSFRRFVEQGLKVARKETAPEMINIPVAYTQVQ